MSSDKSGGQKSFYNRILLGIFALALLNSFALIYYAMIVRHNFVVFTDEEDVPEATDFVATLPEYVETLWTR